MYSCFDSITGRFVNIGSDNRQALNDLIQGKLPPWIVALVKKLATAGQSHTDTMDNHTVNKS